MTGEDFIAVSSLIVGHGDAGCRSATSRAYYGAFHITLKLLEDLQCPLPGRCGHDKPIKCLGYAPKLSSGNNASMVLGNLQGRRVKADYDLQETDPNAQEYGEYSIAMAQHVELSLSQFRQECDANPAMKASFIASVNTFIKLNFKK